MARRRPSIFTLARRLLSLISKPTKEEFKLISRMVLIGFGILGAYGSIISFMALALAGAGIKIRLTMTHLAYIFACIIVCLIIAYSYFRRRTRRR